MELADWLPTLISLTLKSIVMMLAATIVTSMVRNASARLRHLLWCAALSSLLLMPLVSSQMQPLRLAVLPADVFVNESSTQNVPILPTQISTMPVSDAVDFSTIDNTQALTGLSWRGILLLVWMIGVCVVLGRYVVGVFAVRRLVGRGTEVTEASWADLLRELSEELHLTRTVRLLRSPESVMPMTCGSIHTAVVLPREADAWPADRRRVVLLHELIHVKRCDLLTQAVAQIVCAVYWFNPLVWFAAGRLRTEQEWACDERVVATGVARAVYAEHLLEIARRFQANAMTAVTTTNMARRTQLQDRLSAILRPSYQSGRMLPASVVIMSLVFFSAAITQLVTPERDIFAANVSDVVGNFALVSSEWKEPARRERTTVVDMPIIRSSVEIVPTPTPVERSTEKVAEPIIATQDQTPEQGSFTAEDIARLRANGIGAAYIQEMADAGYPRLTVEQLIALFTNSVHADYIEGLRSVGYDNVSVRDLLSLKSNSITPEVIRSYQAVKHAPFEAKKFVALVSNGVTPAYFKSLADAGYDSLSANKGIELRLAGITANFIYEVRARGYVNLSPNDLIELKRREKD